MQSSSSHSQGCPQKDWANVPSWPASQMGTPGSNSECDDGYVSLMSSNEGKTGVWCFPNAKLTRWSEVCVCRFIWFCQKIWQSSYVVMHRRSVHLTSYMSKCAPLHFRCSRILVRLSDDSSKWFDTIPEFQKVVWLDYLFINSFVYCFLHVVT